MRVELKLLVLIGMFGLIASGIVFAISAYLTIPESWISEVLKAIFVALLLVLMCYFFLSNKPVQSNAEVAEDTAVKDWPIIDPMSGIFSRRGITITLLELMALAGRYGRQLSVAIIEIDTLSQVKEEFGREAGNIAIQSIAQSMGETLRMPDRIGHYSEDNFLLVLPETNLQDAGQIAKRLRQVAAETDFQAVEGKKVRLTVSIGLTEYREGEDIQHLVSRAIDLVGAAKNRDPNQVMTSKPSS